MKTFATEINNLFGLTKPSHTNIRNAFINIFKRKHQLNLPRIFVKQNLCGSTTHYDIQKIPTLQPNFFYLFKLKMPTKQKKNTTKEKLNENTKESG